MRINNPLDEVFKNSNSVRILRQLVLYPSKVTTGRGLAGELGMNHATCIRTLDSLVDIGAVSRKTVGRSSVYEMPKDSILYRDFLMPLFEKEANLLNELVGTLGRGVKQHVAAIYIFGSVARAEDTSVSDVDIALILKPGVDKREIEEAVGENERDAYRLFRIGTNVLLYNTDEFERMKKSGHPLVKEILSEGRIAFGKAQ